VRNVIVTGGSRGIGLAIATKLAGGGYRVIAVARQETDALREAMATLGESLRFRSFDLTQTGEISRFLASVRQEHGQIYGLVNNAGLGTSGMLAMMRDEQIAQLMQLNVMAPLLLTKHVLRSMMSAREGRIVNIASIVAATGYSGLSAYSATKAALVGLTRSLAREVGQLGITVNAVSPGFVETALTADLNEEQREQIRRRSALQRLAEPQDVASAVEFLLSEGARNITGTTLTVDAGNTA
jgi:3-oxoacyl-[acyl-carrier protein] reductase